MSDSATFGYSPWYRSLNRMQWRTLIASNLGWTFDGFEVIRAYSHHWRCTAPTP
jgi:hypothetical protein